MLDRRSFLKFIGGGTAGILATPVIWRSLDDISIWTQNWSWIPKLDYGNNNNKYISTVSKFCPSATGTKVRLVGGRPVRVLGNPEHPLSRGGVSSLASTEVQMRYLPSRVMSPLLRKSDGGYVDLSWEDATKLLQQKLAEAKGSVLTISGDANGSLNEVFSAFTKQLGSDKFFIMPGEAQPAARAWELLQTTPDFGRVGYDLENSDYVLAVGANVLENFGTVIANRRAWGESDIKLAYASSAQNNTAAGAETWLPIRPNSDLILLLGLARAIMQERDVAVYPGLEEFKTLVQEVTPELVVATTQVPLERFQSVLNDLLVAKAPLIIAGSEVNSGGSAATVLAALSLNMLLGRLNEDGGVRAVPVSNPVLPGAMSYQAMQQDLGSYVHKVASAKEPGAAVMLCYLANPSYALPGMDVVLKKAGFKVSFANFMDETASACDLVLPASLGMERFDDVAYPFGYGQEVYCLALPVVKARGQAKSAADVLIGLSKSLNMDLGIDNSVKLLRHKATALGANWKHLLQGQAYISREVLAIKPRYRADILEPVALACLNYLAKPLAKNEVLISFNHKLAFGTAETGIPPFNTKIITDELVKAGRQEVLSAKLNPHTLAKVGLFEHNLVKLQGPKGELIARLVVSEEVANDTISLSLGFGHTAFAAFNAHKGANGLCLVSTGSEPATGQWVWNPTVVAASKA